MYHNFKELKVWQHAIELATQIYSATADFPNSERFGLTDQMRRASVSISSNLAEGCGAGTAPQVVRFANIAQGSAFELESQMILATRLRYISEEFSEKILTQIQHIQCLISNFRKYYQQGLKK